MSAGKLKIPTPDEMEFAPFGAPLDDPSEEEPEPVFRPDLQKVNPFCDPEWRWQRGTRLAEEGKEYSPETDDRETCLALKFAQALNACTTEADRAALAKRVPGMYFAYQIYTEGGPSKWVTEARILAGQSLRDVAQAMGVSKETVYWYQKLFFNVVPRLTATDYIRLKIIGESAFQAISPDDTETLLKLFAFYGGPLVLDLAISYLLSGVGGGTSDITNADPKLIEKMRRAIELLSVPDDATSLLRFLQESGETPDGKRPLESLIDALKASGKDLKDRKDQAVTSVGENESTEAEDAAEDARAIDPLEEYESSEPPPDFEEDSRRREPGQSHPHSPPESDEDTRETA